MHLRRFNVKPRVPETLKPLYELAYNVWSTWDQSAIKLFSRIDPNLFRRVNHNPVRFVLELGTERIAALSKDPGFLFELEQVWYKFISYLSFEGSYQDREGRSQPFGPQDIIAYLSMEFSLHESVPIYSGGLGILAGDHLKAASDIGLPLIGFGLLYRYGYFAQRINPEGYQEEEYRENVWFYKPVDEVKDKKGEPIVLSVPLGTESALVKLWKVNVGRTTLYLLDSNLPDNPPKQRSITDMLYDPERDDRIEQELILGRGSRLAMKALGIEPKVYHLNEGHSAFLILERLRELMLEKGLPFEDARNLIRHTTVFTTHTPVIEGNEHFDQGLVTKYILPDLQRLGIPLERFLNFGRVRSGEPTFWLPALAMRFSRYSNGVSRIHAQVSRKMWQPLFEGFQQVEIPIHSVVNAVHLGTWMSHELGYLFDRFVGPDYLHQADSPEVWEKVYGIPDAELWEAHSRCKRELISFIRGRLAEEMERKGFAAGKIKETEDILDPRALTIGFARRFAPYKRANLILQDPKRLMAILTNEERPVQLILSGKSHPADQEGKRIIKQLLDFIKEHNLERKMVFVEDYDMNVARHLVQGVDVWLNNPLKPLEASGTSGMKVGINGGLNLSVMDGWWPECYNGQNGWAITAGETRQNLEVKKAVEANQIYELLEQEIVPMFYDRSRADIPSEWVNWMKNSISTVGRGFNIHRMLRDYLTSFYLPEAETSARLLENKRALLTSLSAMKEQVDSWWGRIYIRDFFASALDKVPFSGDSVQIDCYVQLEDAPEGLFTVEAVHIFGGEEGQMEAVELAFVEKYQDKVAKYSGAFSLKEPGAQEMGVRVRPKDGLFRETYPRYIKWAN